MANEVLWVLGRPYEPQETTDTDFNWVLGVPYPPVIIEGEEAAVIVSGAKSQLLKILGAVL